MKCLLERFYSGMHRQATYDQTASHRAKLQLPASDSVNHADFMAENCLASENGLCYKCASELDCQRNAFENLVAFRSQLAILITNVFILRR